MLDLRKVAVTGGVSCGKSQLCLFLKELGAYVVSTDKIVHQLLSPETDLGKKVTHLLGPEIIENNKIDRKAVAKKVFGNHELLKSLEMITHPEVFQEVEKQYEQCRKEKDHPLFVVEIPLLFEVGSEGWFDTTITVSANEADCIERFEASTGLSKNSYYQRMARQLPPNEKVALADIASTNDGSLEDLRYEAKKIFKQLTTNT
ncbi:MAG: dephospho-CoA kinase [Chlamydiota bacterium]